MAVVQANTDFWLIYMSGDPPHQDFPGRVPPSGREDVNKEEPSETSRREMVTPPIGGSDEGIRLKGDGNLHI